MNYWLKDINIFKLAWSFIKGLLSLITTNVKVLKINYDPNL